MSTEHEMIARAVLAILATMEDNDAGIDAIEAVKDLADTEGWLDELTKHELGMDLRSQYGALVSISDVAEYFKMHRNTAARKLKGLPYFQTNSKRYSAMDVAERMMEGVRI